jgi:hypothetical protein
MTRFTLALLLFLPAAAWAEPSCPLVTPEIEARYDPVEPALDNSLPQPALQKVAGKLHHGGRTLGLYRGEIDAHAATQLRFWQRGDELCVAIARVEARLGYRERRIWVIRERKPGTCDYEVVLGHERQHQAIDDALLGEFLPRMREAVRQAVARLPDGPVPTDERDAALRRANAAVEAAFRSTMRDLSAERERRQNALDNPTEYRRIAAACDKLRGR